ncbi:MAG: hypothetical protein M4579_006079 [Chaenotheca gracillima]|nr:MAG: hypothetical protein M4579_006079 [Chaenotheca gracillima]
MATRQLNNPVAGNAFAQFDRESLMPWESYQPASRRDDSSSIVSSAGSQEYIIQPLPIPQLAPRSRGIFAQTRSVTDPLPSKPIADLPAKKTNEAGESDRPELAKSPLGQGGNNHSRSASSSGDFTPEDSPTDWMLEVHPAFRASEGITSTTDPVKDSRKNNSTPVQFETLPATVFVQPPKVTRPEGRVGHKASSSLSGQPTLGGYNASRPDAMILGNGSMSPTNTGTYGNYLNAKVVMPARIQSMAGVLEEGGSAQVSPSSSYSNDAQTPLPQNQPGNQPTFRHQLESRLRTPGLRQGANQSMSSLRSNISRQKESHPLPIPPDEFDSVVSPTPTYDSQVDSPVPLQELFAEIHEQIRSSTNPIKTKLLSNHDDLIDILTRKFDKSLEAAKDGITALNGQWSSVEKRTIDIERDNAIAHGDLSRQVFSNHDEIRTLVAGNSGTLLTQIESLIRTNNEMFARILDLGRKVDDLELRIEANPCRCTDNRFAGGSRNAFAGMPTPGPELRNHPAFASVVPPTGSGTSHRAASPTRVPVSSMDPPPVPNATHPTRGEGQHSRTQSSESGAGWYQQAMIIKEYEIQDTRISGDEGGRKPKSGGRGI